MTPRAALDAARELFASAATSTATPDQLGNAAEQILQAAFSAPSARGHALIGEGRRLQAITLNDAHALVSLQGWSDRLRDAAADAARHAELTAEWLTARDSLSAEVWAALEHAVEFAEHLERKAAAVAYPPVTGASMSSIVTPAGITTVPTPDAEAAIASGARPYAAQGPAVPRGDRHRAAESTAPRRRRKKWPWVLLVLLIAVSTAAVFYMRDRQERLKAADFNEGVRAFERGDLDLAATTFFNYYNTHNRDERPLLYLARIERTRGNLAAARLHLQKAIAIAPTNAVAMRELASALLAGGNVHLARPFYVRAVDLDPTDRTALGFLACTLHRLGREDEAQRFADRAGTGEWTPCLAAVVRAPPPPVNP